MEPGFGEKREEALRLAGIKTFFIVKALKPVCILEFTEKITIFFSLVKTMDFFPPLFLLLFTLYLTISVFFSAVFSLLIRELKLNPSIRVVKTRDSNFRISF